MSDEMTDPFIENRPFEELAIGEAASLSRTVTQRCRSITCQEL